MPEPEAWAIHKVAVSQLRTGKDRKIKMISDLKVARLITNELGEDRILNKVTQFKGKFLNLFRKGWDQYKSNNIFL